MNAVKQKTAAATTPACQRFDWCSGRLHGDDLGNIHTRSEFFLHRTIELALEVFEEENRAHLYVQFDHNDPDADAMYSSRDHVLRDQRDTNILGNELRRLADAIDQAEQDMVKINAALTEVPC